MNSTRSHEQDALRRDRNAIEAELRTAGAQFKGKACKCPFHDDKHPSAGIYESDGVWFFKCQVCGAKGDVFDIIARVQSVAVADVLTKYRPATVAIVKSAAKPPMADPVQGLEPSSRRIANLEAIKSYAHGIEGCYVYTHPTTRISEMVVLRIRRVDGGKKFIQFRPLPGGGFEDKAPPAPRPIYNRTRMLTADTVVVVEGEKCVHALADIGIVGTTSPGGAGNASHADWSPLAGKVCVLWPDNDPVNPPGRPNAGKRTGIEHMREVAAILQKLSPPPKQVLWVDPDDLSLPDKADVVDYIAEYGGATIGEKRRAVETIISIAAPMGPADELSSLIEDIIAGKKRAIPFPWPVLTRLTRAMAPGLVTILAGDPGCGKSFMLLEAAAYWHLNGVKVAVYELEDDLGYHLNRALAQLDDQTDLTDFEWIRLNPEASREAMKKHRVFLDGFARCITTTTSETGDVALPEILKWIQSRCDAGAEIIIVDPITAAGYVRESNSWQEDRDFVIHAKSIVKKAGSRLILSTHPKVGAKSGKGASVLHSLSGGAAYPRFAHTVLWINNPEKPRKVKVASPHGTFHTTATRTLRLGKTRNGPGGGVELAYTFGGDSLRFSEQGAIECDDERGEKIGESNGRPVHLIQDPFADDVP